MGFGKHPVLDDADAGCKGGFEIDTADQAVFGYIQRKLDKWSSLRKDARKCTGKR